MIEPSSPRLEDKPVRRSLLPCLLTLALCGIASSARGQAGFVPPPPPVVVPPFVPPVIPTPVGPTPSTPRPFLPPGDGAGPGAGAPVVHQESPPSHVAWWPGWLVIGVMATVLVGSAALVVAGLLRRRSAPAGRQIRITATPPGEAPEAVRRAWVGLTLPLAHGHPAPAMVPVQGVVHGQPGGYWTGYLVDGRQAVERLAAAHPEAAGWWRQHARHVLARGYCMVFPVEVCDLLEAAAFVSHPDGTVEDVRRG
jgi:hypothetical protein